LKGMLTDSISYEVDKATYAHKIAVDIINTIEDKEMRDSALEYGANNEIEHF